MTITKFSVLMSVYKNENPVYFRQSIFSILKQTRKAHQIVIVCDGLLTDDLYKVIDECSSLNPNLFSVIKYSENKGLGKALNIGLKECRYEYVARMDTDDIAHEDRFEKQISFLEENENIAVLGSYIAEFSNNINNIISYREVPVTNESILKFAKQRNPFNHMTVVFKKSVILKVGGYKDMPLAEDYYLWARVLSAGYECANIAIPLVYARAGNDMIKRRSGLSYAKKINNLRFSLYKIHFISLAEYILYSLVHSLVAICPMNLKRYIYTNILHTANEDEFKV